MATPSKSSAYTITVDKVMLDRGGQRVLDGVSLTVNKAEVMALIGPNGSGKSSLLSVMSGLLIPGQGQRFFHDEKGESAEITRIGFMLQHPVLLRRSLLGNLSFAMAAAGIPRSEHNKRSLDVLGRVGLLERAKDSALQLSQGERQRLALARVIAMEAGLMMFDEATSNLDPASVLTIEETAKRLCREGRPVLWVSHDLAQVRRLADRVVMLVKGKIEADTDAWTFFEYPPTKRAEAFIRGELITD
jgi:tungstate transport system ATP-binding protein